jgi:hypothetical protein
MAVVTAAVAAEEITEWASTGRQTEIEPSAGWGH